MIELYLAGALIMFGIELASSDFRVYDLIVVPLLWPFALLMQFILLFFMWLEVRGKNSAQH